MYLLNNNTWIRDENGKQLLLSFYVIFCVTLQMLQNPTTTNILLSKGSINVEMQKCHLLKNDIAQM
jgi:hypothetical protein